MKQDNERGAGKKEKEVSQSHLRRERKGGLSVTSKQSKKFEKPNKAPKLALQPPVLVNA